MRIHGIFISSEGKKVYIVYNGKLREMFWGDNDDKFDYKVEIDENSDSFRIYKNSVYKRNQQDGGISQLSDYRLRDPNSNPNSYSSTGNSSIKEEFGIERTTEISPKKGEVSSSLHSFYRKYRNNEVAEEARIDLNQPLLLQTSESKEEEEVNPIIIEIIGNEIEVRRKQHEDEQAEETSQIISQVEIPPKKFRCFFCNFY